MLPCNHPLCRGCATQCLRQNQRCPQCLTAIPNLRMLQGRNKWIAEMVGSLKNCLNEVGVSLTQHAPGMFFLCVCVDALSFAAGYPRYVTVRCSRTGLTHY